MSIFGLFRGAKLVEDIQFSCRRKICQASVAENPDVGSTLTWVLKREVISLTKA